MSATSVPLVIIPEPSHGYAYPVPPINHQPDRRVIALIGQSIRPEYESGARWTPIQKNRAYAISAIAVSIIGGAVSIMFGAVASSAIAFVAIPLAAVGVVGGYYLATRKEDLDSPKERDAVKKKIAAMGAQVILNRPYSVEKILNYALLDRVTGPGTPHEIGPREIFYEKFAQLARAYNEIYRQHNNQVNQIERQYTVAVGDVMRWRSDQYRIIEQRNIIANQTQIIASQNRARAQFASATPRRDRSPYAVAGRDAAPRRGAAGATVLEGIAIGVNLGVHLHGEFTRQEVNRLWEEAIAPAAHWRQTEIEKAEMALHVALNTLDVENSYAGLLQEFKNAQANILEAAKVSIHQMIANGLAHHEGSGKEGGANVPPATVVPVLAAAPLPQPPSAPPPAYDEVSAPPIVSAMPAPSAPPASHDVHSTDELP